MSCMCCTASQACIFALNVNHANTDNMAAVTLSARTQTAGTQKKYSWYPLWAADQNTKLDVSLGLWYFSLDPSD